MATGPEKRWAWKSFLLQSEMLMVQHHLLLSKLPTSSGDYVLHLAFLGKSLISQRQMLKMTRNDSGSLILHNQDLAHLCPYCL
jgi:hypothetical protein